MPVTVLKTLDVDRIDLALLSFLAQNCRLSHAALGRALRLSKDAVRYRIQSLKKRGYIQREVMFIDARKLGFTRYHLLLRLSGDSISRERIAEKLTKHPAVMWINTFIGSFDIQIIVDAIDGFDLNKIRKELFALADGKVIHYSVLTHLYDLEFTQLNPLLDHKIKWQTDPRVSQIDSMLVRKFPVSAEFQRVPLKRIDYEILKCLADNPVATITEVAENCRLDRQTVRSRIERVVNNGLILSFGAIPNLSQLGFVTYYLLIRLTQNISPSVLASPFRKLQNIFYSGRMLGDYDLIIYLNARSPQELDESINLFRREVSQEILHYELLVQEQVLHWRQFSRRSTHLLLMLQGS